jgi:hypothetical protein
MTDKSKNITENEKTNEKTKIKKTYRSPQFEIYGSLSSLTHGGKGNKNDGLPHTTKA